MRRIYYSFLAKLAAAVLTVNTAVVPLTAEYMMPAFASPQAEAVEAGEAESTQAEAAETESSAETEDAEVTSPATPSDADTEEKDVTATGSDALYDEDGFLLDGSVKDDALLEGKLLAGAPLQEVPEIPEPEEYEGGEECITGEATVPDGTDPETGIRMDADRRLLGYFEQQLFEEEDALLQQELLLAKRETTLSGTTLSYYKSLREQVRRVAAGEQESSRLTILYSSLGSSVMEKVSYKDLGLSKAPAELVDGDWKWDETLVQQGREKMHEKVNADNNVIFHALLADLPYDCYWTDHKIDWSYDLCGVNVEYVDGEVQAWFSYGENAGVTFSFKAGIDYRMNASDFYTLNTAKTSAATKAAANAKAIVQKAAADGLDDYQKLKRYLEKICELTSYDTEAMKKADGDLYGSANPWQLIYVFDDDTTNKVVCEGYAKAFQYLCDLTSFQDSGISSVLVSGPMGGGTGEGPHMWNIVTMEDGENYLVDVTNCDGDAVGAPNKLFLRGYTRKRSDGAWEFDITGEGLTTTISYGYDSDTKSLYTEKELSYSDSDYVWHMPEAHGKCGDSLWWNVAGEPHMYTLTITGDGPMYDYAEDTVPWKNYRTEIHDVKLDSGLTSIGAYAFSGICAADGKRSLTRIDVPDTVARIGKGAFKGCGTQIIFTGTECAFFKNVTVEEGWKESCTVLCLEGHGHSFNLTADMQDGTHGTVHFSCGSCGREYRLKFTQGSGSCVITDFENAGDFSYVIIPAIINDLPVRTIAGTAFKDSMLTLTIIPSTVQTIEDGAFAKCDGRMTVYGYTGSVAQDLAAKLGGSFNSQGVQCKGITLNSTALTVEKGKNVTATGEVTPADATNLGFRWTSSDTSVATVDDYGKITGISAGTAVITVLVENGYCTASCTVTVEEVKDPVEVFVRRLYTTCLGREADAGGLSYWCGLVRTGKKKGIRLAADFVFSAEFTGKNYCNRHFVEQIYPALMGRAADPGGLAYWTERLDNGITREALLNGFASSKEYKELCTAAGFEPGGTIKETDYKAAKGIGTKPYGPCVVCGEKTKVVQFAERMYTVCLGRQADAGGLRYWSKGLYEHTVTGKSILEFFFLSSEIKGRHLENKEYVRRIYRAMLDREPDAGGLAFWTGRLDRGASPTSVIAGFIESAEFRKICTDYGIVRK